MYAFKKQNCPGWHNIEHFKIIYFFANNLNRFIVVVFLRLIQKCPRLCVVKELSSTYKSHELTFNWQVVQSVLSSFCLVDRTSHNSHTWCVLKREGYWLTFLFIDSVSVRPMSTLLNTVLAIVERGLPHGMLPGDLGMGSRFINVHITVQIRIFAMKGGLWHRSQWSVSSRVLKQMCLQL